VSSSPIDDIETGKAFTDLGSMGLATFKGAREAGATMTEALFVTAAMYFGLFKSNQADPEES